MSNTPKKTEGAKNPRVNIKFDEQQREAHQKFHEYDVNFLTGKFASGKTACAVAMGILSYRKKLLESIWITRPVIRNNVGYLPGRVEDKMDPWVFPIIQNFNQCQSPVQTEKMIKDGTIVIKPVDFLRGVTTPKKGLFIVDEFQNLSYEDFKVVLSRLGKDSKIIFCGDPTQSDYQVVSCYPKIKHLKDSGLVGWTELTSNHRNPVLTNIFDILD